ncbi:unnamed protein product, partial [Polarella glacialis]
DFFQFCIMATEREQDDSADATSSDGSQAPVCGSGRASDRPSPRRWRRQVHGSRLVSEDRNWPRALGSLRSTFCPPTRLGQST